MNGIRPRNETCRPGLGQRVLEPQRREDPQAAGRRSRIMLIIAFTVAGLASVIGLLNAQDRFLPADRLTTGDRVLKAFQGATAASRAWTVRLRRGRRDVALGVVVRREGLILTKSSELSPPPGRGARSAADAAKPLECRLSDGRVLAATVLASDPDVDLALLSIEAKDLTPVEWSEAPPELGRWVFTPEHGPAPVAAGIISSQRRAVAAEFVPGVLGVRLAEGDGPATVREIFEDSAAEQAGLKIGDGVKKFDDTPIDHRFELIDNVRRKNPGDAVVLSILRDGEAMQVEATLSHPFGSFLSQFAQQTRMGGELSLRRDGFNDVFAHDAVLRPADCGGPLVDLSGRAIGLNIARSGRTETLALPAEVVQASLAKLLADSDRQPADRPPPPPAAERAAAP